MSNFNVNGQLNWEENAPKTYALRGKIMLSVILVLFLVIFWYLLRVRHRYLNSRRQRATHIVFYVDSNSSTSVPNRGLDESILNSLPVFIFARTNPDGIDCAVCLSEFEENEKGRILPKCHHSFHTDCIDMWFRTHSTCPICRAPVEAQVPAQPPQNSRSELMVSIDDGLDADPAGSSSTVSSTSMADGRKGLDLVGVRIKVPRRSESVEELPLSSPASHGFKSPGSRLHSLKRILSMNRRSEAVSPTSEIGASCGSAGAEFDIELGRAESSHGQARVLHIEREYSKRVTK